MKKTTPTPPVNSNQTQFAAEEPLFEKIPITLEESQAAPQLASAKKPMTKNKKILVGAGILALVLVVLVILLAVASKKQPTQKDTGTVSAIPEIKNSSQLEEKLLNIEQDLKQANPTLQDLPFPPINLKLRID